MALAQQKWSAFHSVNGFEGKIALYHIMVYWEAGSLGENTVY